MEEPTIDDALAIAELVLDLDHSTITKMTELGLLDSALHAPFAGYGDVDVYPEPWRKCAILGSRLARNHPFTDGNKRVAFLVMRAFARLNGFEWAPGNDTGPMIESLAAGELAEDEFAECVRGSWSG